MESFDVPGGLQSLLSATDANWLGARFWRLLPGLVVWAAATRGWGEPLFVVGRNTLPIYVLQPVLLLAVPKPQAMPGASWVILLTLATVLLGLLIGRWLNRIPGLLALPPLGAALRPRLAR
jgi:hypothetical protein